jgi:hypothetical protein
MSTDIVPAKTFEQKMMDRIRDSIGDLMSDEDLKKICAAGVEKALFTATLKRDGWNNTREDYSIVEKAAREFLDARMRAAIEKWLAENPDAFQKAIDAAVKAGVAGCVDATINLKFGHIFSELQRFALPPQNR